VIRELAGDDVERVGAIWLAASLRAHDFVPAEFWRTDHRVMVGEILPRARGFVHLTGESIDGFITIQDGSVGCLFVDPPHQRRGIGQALLDRVKREHGTLRLNVYAQNAGARRFYEREGFRETGRSTCPHTGCPELVMEWRAERGAIPGG